MKRSSSSARGKSPSPSKRSVINSKSSSNRKMPVVEKEDVEKLLTERVDDDDGAGWKQEEPNLEGDYLNVALLLLLYFLQGVPMGISSTLDVTMQESKKLSFEQQGVYSSVGWPYSLKMLWAPIVDSVYIRSVGRRKTWLIPTQVLIGALLVTMADYVESALVDLTSSLYRLTLLFFTFYVLAATQDIAVDGWALELLQKRNLGWASTCNMIGLTIGYATSYTGLIALKSYDICTLGTYMKISGMIYLITTFLVWKYKTEVPYKSTTTQFGGTMIRKKKKQQSVEQKEEEAGETLNIKESYLSMFKIISLPSVKLLIFALLTRAVPFAPTDTLSSRKLIGYGMKKEQIAMFAAFLTPIGIVITGLVSKYTATRPMSLFIEFTQYRLALACCSVALVYFAPRNLGEGGNYLFWSVLVVLSIAGSLVTQVQFVSLMSFYAKISDPLVGGSYMTTLNTATNLGSKWPNTLSLFIVNYLTVEVSSSLYCRLVGGDATCFSTNITIDGYYVLNFFSILFGVFWYRYFKVSIKKLENLDEKHWRVE